MNISVLSFRHCWRRVIHFSVMFSKSLLFRVVIISSCNLKWIICRNQQIFIKICSHVYMPNQQMTKYRNLFLWVSILFLFFWKLIISTYCYFFLTLHTKSISCILCIQHVKAGQCHYSPSGYHGKLHTGDDWGAVRGVEPLFN